LIKSLETLAESVGANYAGIWCNSELDGSLNCYLKYHWSRNSYSAVKENKTFYRYDDLCPLWNEKLAENKYLICDAGDLPAEFLDLYEMKEAKSILILPFYLHGVFWGLLGFTRSEDTPFTPCEAETLLTGARIIAFSVSRHEILGKLNRDREKALANTLAKSEFVSRMSHEMRTPLNAIIGMTNFALKEKDPQKLTEYLNKVQISSQMMLTIINDVLDMSKIEAGKLEIVREAFDFAGMIRNAEKIVRIKMDEKEQRFTVNCDNSMIYKVVGDEHRLLQVIINLLNNAMKFTPRCGEITLSALQTRTGEDKVKLSVEVRDNGIGMTWEQQQRLFNAFEQADGSITRKYGGTGLGLTICKKILNAMGGDIWVKSEPNQGSCFFFELEAALGELLPNTQIEVPAEEAEEAEKRYNWKNRTILLADDVEINREIVSISLEDTGVSIVSAENGAEVIQKYSEKPGMYDLILMDVQMPVMDGLTATRKIRSMEDPHSKKIPIIAMTANAFKEDINICIKAGMNEHVAKPIDMDLFFRVLERYLN